MALAPSIVASGVPAGGGFNRSTSVAVVIRVAYPGGSPPGSGSDLRENPDSTLAKTGSMHI